MLEKSFGLFFFLKQPKNQKSDERYVYLRITVDGIPKEISLKRTWDISKWDQPKGRAKGGKEDAMLLNAYLDVFREKVYSIKGKLISENKTVTSTVIKSILTGSDVQKRMVLVAIAEHNRKMAALVGIDFAPGTLERYETVYDHVQAFIKWKYDREDLELQALNYDFAADFAFWLKHVRKCNHNTTMKYISNFKKIVLDAVKRGVIPRDPFSQFKTTQKEVKKVALTVTELEAIKDLKITIDRLAVVRDIFLFSCYTGLAYVDVQKLKRVNITRNIDGELWIDIERQKTETSSRLPLLPDAVGIMDRYENHPRCMQCGSVLPVLTNQKMNAYLKEIADLAGINKNLTYHIARHTFATTVTLTNGVPLESVSKMLGHRSIKQTQHYAKIVDIKISADMAALKAKLVMQDLVHPR